MDRQVIERALNYEFKKDKIIGSCNDEQILNGYFLPIIQLCVNVDISFFIKRTLIALIIIASSQTINAQYYLKLSSHNKKALKYYHQAEQSFKERDNAKALIFLNKALKKDDSFIEAWLLKGDVLVELNRPGGAINAYNKAVSIDSAFFPPAWYFLGNLYYDSGLYDKAVAAYEVFLKFDNGLTSQHKLAANRLMFAQSAAELMRHQVNISPVLLDSSINTRDDEYINFADADNKRLIFTRKQKIDSADSEGVFYREQFYFTDKIDSVWLEPKPWLIPWAADLNVGGMSLSVDGSEIFFTGCGWPGSYGGCDLYQSELRGNKWQKPRSLGTSINSSGWESQPYVSSDGKMLLFSSTRKGGKGGSDIWMSVKLKNGKWSQPVNMGDSINTSGNEMAPFLYADNKTLLFSSDGWPGLGKQDIFISRRTPAGFWTKAKNIGFPANTKYAEINMIYSLDGKQAWISSNRGSGNFDIYQLPVYDAIRPEKIIYFTGIVLDKSTRKPLRAKVTLTDGITGVNLLTRYSDAATGSFLMVIIPDKTYAFNIMDKGYLLYSERLFMASGSLNAEKRRREFLLSPIKPGEAFVLENIYFNVDRSELQPKSFPELNKLASFMKLNPSVKIQISGHTDNTGDDAYNMKLSELRAKAVYTYLIKKGVSANRLIWKGYGNTKPVADNSTKTGRAMNRRVEIVVL